MFDPGRSSHLQKSLVTYAFADGASPAIVQSIKTALLNGIEWLVISQLTKCPYKTYMMDSHYHWGSNAAKATWGIMVLTGAKLKINLSKNQLYERIAEEYVHYFHGRNPMGYTYITQSQLFGADKSITQMSGNL